MSRTRQSFEAQVGKWAKKVRMDTQDFVRLLALRIHDRIVMRTPVDTGRARASWTIVEGEVADLSVEDEKVQLTESEAGAAALARHGSLGRSDVYTIANNLPYITALENGHSGQAPNGMVRLAIADEKTALEVELGR
jgi:hypothetical protein